MSRIRKYCVWCETEAAKVCDWSAAVPTQCPNNAGHTITAAKTFIVETRESFAVLVDPTIEPVVPGASKVVANDRPAIEIQAATSGYGAMQLVWPHLQNDAAKVALKVSFIMKESGTGTTVRIAARVKAHGDGDDSSSTWHDSAAVDVTVDYSNVGDVWTCEIELDADAFDVDDAVALQVGRDGSHANDTSSVAVQIIGTKGLAQ